MIQTPLVSIVCTTYNHQAYIKDALEGFVMQKTNFSFEIIVHDDASTDNTANIIKEYEEKFPELFVNIYQTINQFSRKEEKIWSDITFPVARGKYIALCEGDDYWTDPLKLQKQLDFLESNTEYSMVCHNALIVNQIDNTSRLFHDTDNNKHIYSTRDTFNVHLCPTASLFFRKPSLDLFDLFPLDTSAGDQMLIQLISLTGLIYRMEDIMSVYRIHPFSITQSGKIGIIQVLQNRKSDLMVFNKISEGKFRRNIWIEIFLINRRIDFLKKPSNFNSKVFKISRKIMAVIKKTLKG